MGAALRRCWPALVAGVVLAVVVAAMAALSQLPFQDLPNHALTLARDRWLAGGGTSESLARPDVTVYGYSLHVQLGRLFAAVASPERAMRMVFIVAALVTPLGAARLARALGLSWQWAALLALPLTLSWSMKMGFASYVLAVPLLLAALGAALSVLAAATLVNVTELAALAVLCQLAHPLAFVIALALIATLWHGLRRDVPAALTLLGCLAPAILLLAHDLAVGGYAQIPATEATWRPVPLAFRPMAGALAHVLTRSLGIADARDLLASLPFAGLIGWGAISAARGAPSARGRALECVSLLALVTAFGSVFVPRSYKNAWMIGDRIPLVGVALMAVLAAAVVQRLARPWQWLVPLVVVLPVAAALCQLHARAERIGAILHGGPLHQLDGSMLTMRLSDCPATLPDGAWGHYDSERFLWAQALDDRAVTPYLFAFGRYLPVWYRGDYYARTLVAPPEWEMNALRSSTDETSCERAQEERIRGATSLSNFDRLVVVGMPERISATMERLSVDGWSARHVTDGIALWMRSPQR